MKIIITKVILLALIFNVNTACDQGNQNPISGQNNLVSQEKTLGDTDKSEKTRPLNKTATISVEGEKNSINLKLYQEKSLFSTYFPETDFLVKTQNINKVTEVKFITKFEGVKNENAYIEFVFNNDLKTLGKVKKLINSKNGIIASSGWKVTNRSSNVTYPWAKEKINFSKGQEIFGDIYIGEEKGKVFYVITHYPVEYGDGFEPRADLILSNLEIGG